MSKNPVLVNVATRIINTPLLITQNKLNAIIGAVGARIGLQAPKELASPVYMGPEREREESGAGIAVIPVYDVLVYRANGLLTLSGLTSYEQIRADFTEAMNDDAVQTIIFDIDSPGGEVAGLFDLVDEIYEARGDKAIYAVANEAAYSAAYAIASAADAIYLPRTAGLGSIGVIAVHVDQSAYDEKEGFNYTPVFSGARKNDFSRHKPLSDDARAVLQAEIDEIYELFVETVGRNRDIAPSVLRDTEAAIFQGKKAVKAGLADTVLSWDKAMANITNESKGGVFMSLKEKFQSLFSGASKQEADQALAEIGYVPGEAATGEADATVQPDADAQSVDAQKITEEVLAGATEIMEICSLAGMPDLALDLVKGGASAEEARKRVFEAKAEQGDNTEIVSTVGPMSTGETNPLIADAERRAKASRA